MSEGDDLYSIDSVSKEELFASIANPEGIFAIDQGNPTKNHVIGDSEEKNPENKKISITTNNNPNSAFTGIESFDGRPKPDV